MNEAEQDMKTKQIEDRKKNWIFTNLPGANMVQKSANQMEIKSKDGKYRICLQAFLDCASKTGI